MRKKFLIIAAMAALLPLVAVSAGEEDCCPKTRCCKPCNELFTPCKRDCCRPACDKLFTKCEDRCCHPCNPCGEKEPVERKERKVKEECKKGAPCSPHCGGSCRELFTPCPKDCCRPCNELFKPCKRNCCRPACDELFTPCHRCCDGK